MEKIGTITTYTLVIDGREITVMVDGKPLGEKAYNRMMVALPELTIQDGGEYTANRCGQIFYLDGETRVPKMKGRYDEKDLPEGFVQC